MSKIRSTEADDDPALLAEVGFSGLLLIGALGVSMKWHAANSSITMLATTRPEHKRTRYGD